MWPVYLTKSHTLPGERGGGRGREREREKGEGEGEGERLKGGCVMVISFQI